MRLYQQLRQHFCFTLLALLALLPFVGGNLEEGLRVQDLRHLQALRHQLHVALTPRELVHLYSALSLNTRAPVFSRALSLNTARTRAPV